MVPATLFTILALLCAQGTESNMVESFKEEVEKLMDQLVTKVVMSSSELQLAVNEARGQSSGMDWDACEKLSESLIEGESVIGYATQLGAQIVTNFTGAVGDLLKCVQLDPFQTVKCVILQIDTIRTLAIDTKIDADEYGKNVTDLAAQIKDEFWECFGSTTTTTVAPTTTVASTAAPPQTSSTTAAPTKATSATAAPPQTSSTAAATTTSTSETTTKSNS